MGDFTVTLDPDNADSDQLSIDLKDNLLEIFLLVGLKQTVTSCTRQVQSQKPSLIDHSWVSSINKLVSTINIETDSDHDMVLTTLMVRGTVRNVETFKKRNFSKLIRKVTLLN